MSQPEWLYVVNLGDCNPIEYGGAFLYTDNTGVYPPELEIWEPPEEDPVFPMDGSKANPEWDEDPAEEKTPEQIPDIYKGEIWRFTISDCTWIDGILSDNRFHPNLPAWFAHPYDPARPQDGPGGLEQICRGFGIEKEELVKMFTDENPKIRARAWMTVGETWGWDNLDHYPRRLTITEARERYKAEIEASK